MAHHRDRREPRGVSQVVAADITKWAAVVKAAGIVPE